MHAGFANPVDDNARLSYIAGRSVRGNHGVMKMGMPKQSAVDVGNGNTPSAEMASSASAASKPHRALPEPPAPLSELRRMIREKKLTKETFGSKEWESLWSSATAYLNSEDPAVVWTALSTFGRMASVSDPARHLAEPVLASRLENPLPEFIRLPDGDDRYYLARSLTNGNSSEIVDIAFRELAEEETSERARRVWGELAGKDSVSLSAFLERLNSELADVVKRSGMSPDAVCRRVKRICAEIEDLLSIGDLGAGEDIGRQIRNLFLGHLPRSGPEDRALREETSNFNLATLKKIVRLNLSSRTDPESYGLIDEIRAWWHPASPPRSFESAAGSVAGLGIESLLMFSKQGVKNKPLRDALVAAVGKRVFMAKISDAVERAPGLDETVAYWLLNGKEPGERRSAGGFEALSEAKLDESVGRLLIALDSPEFHAKSLERALGEVKDIMPDEGRLLEGAVTRIPSVRQWATAIARARRVELRHERMESVRYDPKEHVGDENLKIDSEVRVLVPGIVKESRDGIKVVLVKAEVEQSHE